MIGRLAILAAASAVLLGGCQLVSIVDPGPWSCLTFQVEPVDGVPVPDGVATETIDVMVDRVASVGVRARNLMVIDSTLVTLGLPTDRMDRWSKLLTQPGELTFVPVPIEHSQDVIDGQPLPPDIDPTSIFDGSGVIDAQASADELGRPSVSISLDAEAADLFDAYAAAHYGERFAIVLDGIVLSAPSINATEFNGQAQISGDFGIEEMENLVAIVASGPLPAPVETVGVMDPVGGSC